MASQRAVVAGLSRLLRFSHASSTAVNLIQPGLYDASKRIFGVSVARHYASLPPHTELAMPALSPTMTQGNIAKWHVSPGDEIAPGTVLADIETDKATLAFENQEDGFIAAILRPDGARDVPVGEAVAIIVEDSADVAAFAGYKGAVASREISSSGAAAVMPPPSTSPAAAGGAATAPATGSYPEHIALAMPALSPTMEMGNIVSWAVREGDEVTPGTVLAEIETDKATLAFENQDEGFIAKIVAPAGSRDVRVGAVVAVIVERQEDIAAFVDYGATAAAAPATAATVAAATAAGGSGSGHARVAANHRLGPAARMALAEAGLLPEDITPTGPRGIITKPDVLAAVRAGTKRGDGISGAAPMPVQKQQQQQQPAAAAAAAAAAPPPPKQQLQQQKATTVQGTQFEDIPTTQVRRIIAKRLLESKQTTPALYISAEVSLDALDELRRSLAAQGTKISVNDCVMRAVALALRDVPEANAYWDAAAGASVRIPAVDVAVAVATEGGLLTPIVRSADAKSLQAIAAEVRELAGRARAGKLKPEEFTGGSFSVSNLGMFGLASFSAIINPPQGAILAVGGASRRTALGPSGTPVSRSVMSVTLSADHRLYDGVLAVALLDAFKGYMETPLKMLV